MIITTIFNIGQKVWFKTEGSEDAIEGRIANITIDVSSDHHINIEYWSASDPGHHPAIYSESEVFFTKEEAMK